MANSVYCLICCKAVISDQSSKNSNISQFEKGLQLFSKLIGFSWNYGDKIFWGEEGGTGERSGVIGGPPCCKECFLAFEQMLRIQQAIELMQATLIEQLEKLKVALQTSVPSDYEGDRWKIPDEDIFGKIRYQLLSCVRNSTTTSPLTSDHHIFKRRKEPCTKFRKESYSVLTRKGKEYQPCSVILDRLPASVLNSSVHSSEEKNQDDTVIKEEIITSFDDPIKLSGDPNDDDGGHSVRKSKLKALEFIRKNSTPEKHSASATLADDNCSDLNEDDDVSSVPVAFSPIQVYQSDDDADEYPWESEANPVSENLPPQINTIRGTSRDLKFSLISPDTLLYQYTLIKVSQGYTHFTCQEAQCPSPSFTDSSLNWNSVFNQIADHIDAVHSIVPSKDDLRTCPLCPATLPPGFPFRAHLISTLKKYEGHRIETVACEICWRPIRNLSDAYKCHLWHHKNDKEKVDCAEGPPTTILAKAKVSNKLRRKLEKILEKSGKKLLLNWEKRKVVPKPEKKLVKKCVKRKLDIPKLKKQSCSKSVGGGTHKDSDHFARVVEENSRDCLLLYKFTLVKASYGVSLTCQESSCDHVLNGTDFTAFEEFKNHVKNCHAIPESKTSWKCPLCCEVVETANGFRRHLLHHCPTTATCRNNNCRFICTACWRPMNSVSCLEYHQWLHKSEIEKEYALRNQEQQPPPPLVKIREMEKQSQLKCRHCQRGFKFVVTLRAHEATHVPKEERKKYICHQCPRQFLSAVAVRGHVEREHQRELMRIRTCPICNKEYNWRDGYKFRTHVKSHKNERNWICDKCGMAFLNTVGLKTHTEYVHGKRERKFQCEFCEMNYLTKRHLTRHRRNAHKDKLGEEEMMEDEQQRLKFTLPEHRPDFIGPRIAFPCPVCEKVFPLRSRMKKHWEKSCKNKS